MIFPAAVPDPGAGELPRPASAPMEIVHIVEKGETMQGLALRYGSTLAAMKRRNKLFSGDVFVGQALAIPQSSSPAATAEASGAIGAIGGTAIGVPPIVHPTPPLPAAVPGEARFDTAGLWDKEDGFLSLRSDTLPDSDAAPCTWIGTLFRPDETCVLSSFVMYLRLVKGETLQLRMLVAEWEQAPGRSVGRPGRVLHSSPVMALNKTTKNADRTRTRIFAS